jgi:hypothetical protein
MLVRRLRDRLCQNRAPICIGTSATMTSEGGDETRAAVVATVASRLFGTRILPDAVIDESLERATDPKMKVNDSLRENLRTVLDTAIDPSLQNERLKTHPLAVWIELQIGLEDGQKLSRRLPMTLAEAAQRFLDFAGKEPVLCREGIQEMLSTISKASSQRAQSTKSMPLVAPSFPMKGATVPDSVAMAVDGWVAVVDRAIQLIGEDHVGLGTDFDGGHARSRHARRPRPAHGHRRHAPPRVQRRANSQVLGRQPAESLPPDHLLAYANPASPQCIARRSKIR